MSDAEIASSGRPEDEEAPRRISSPARTTSSAAAKGEFEDEVDPKGEPGQTDDEKAAEAERRYQEFVEDAEKQKTNSPIAYYIAWPSIMMKKGWHNHSWWAWPALIGTLIVAYFAFLITGCVMNWNEAMGLLIITIIVCTFILWEMLVVKNWDKVLAFFKPVYDFFLRFYVWFKWGFILICAGLLLAFIIVEGISDGAKMIPVLGFFIFLYLSVLFSLFPHRIVWRPVIWGLGVSFVFGIIVMRTSWGYDAIKWLSDYVSAFLAFAAVGAEFVFGRFYEEFWAFFVLPVILFVGGCVGALYYVGLMQYIISKIAYLMQISLKTSGAESTVGAANIFIGQTESPLLVGPYLPYLSNSELLSVMTTGFASIAGSVLGAFIGMGIPVADLLTACVTSAPAALATAKLCHPEIGSNSDDCDVVKGGFKSTASNVVEAFAVGVSEAIPLVMNIGAMLIGFLSIIEFLDAVVAWLGTMVNVYDPKLSLIGILGWIFWPFVWICGVEQEDCLLAGEFAAVRIIGNEFLAFADMSVAMDLRKACAPKRNDDGKVQWLNPRSESITVYILCGFANLGSVGMVIGALSALCPPRAKDIARLALPALWAANMACFIRGCLAALFYDEGKQVPIVCPDETTTTTTVAAVA